MVSFDLGKYPNTTFFLDDLILSFSGVICLCLLIETNVGVLHFEMGDLMHLYSGFLTQLA
jgi:hypothetical protein